MKKRKESERREKKRANEESEWSNLVECKLKFTFKKRKVKRKLVLSIANNQSLENTRIYRVASINTHQKWRWWW